MRREHRGRPGAWSRACAGAAMLAAGAAGASSALAQAESAPRLAIDVQVEREEQRTDAQGRLVLQRAPVEVARPGDVLVYTLTARNSGGSPARGARIEDPIPQGTVLLLDSLRDENTPSDASLDGGKSWQPFPARVARKTETGEREWVDAPQEAYTHLRWSFTEGLDPGQARSVSFRVRVN